MAHVFAADIAPWFRSGLMTGVPPVETDGRTDPGAEAGRACRPLVVDLDGTLIRTDMLIEAFMATLSRRPLDAIAGLAALREGKAALKARLAQAAPVDAAHLPFNEEVVSLVRSAKAGGRPVYLASAADRAHVDAVARHVGLFDGTFASDAKTNLSGEAKARALVAAFGQGGFDYVGDHAVDEPVWRAAHGVYLADARRQHLTRIRQWAPHAEAVGEREAGLADYVKPLRIHQWLKNILVLVPALAAHHLGSELLADTVGFVAFSLCASSVYIVNDLVDLAADRAHPRKRFRPIASGRIPLVHAAIMAPLLLLSAFVLALALPLKFSAVLAGYFVLTCLYSFDLKRRAIVDVVVLACLYGARLLAGSAASGIDLSPWLAAFAVFLFTCLALVKRCSEIRDRIAASKSDPPGRGYRLSDLPVLQSMAAASGYVSVLVLALYFNSDAVKQLYDHYNRLWVVCVLLIYWLSRTLLLTHRGEMHDDPVVFAATDRVSQLTALCCGAVVLVSI
jgi:4-hydroxybenzoate polyprenyltransferase